MLVLFLVSLASFASGPQTEARALALVPGTRVRLAAPPGHVQGAGFHGYSWPETGASLIVIEMPGPYAEVKKGFDKKGLESGGMKLIERKETKICGRAGVLVFAAQDSQGKAYRKWVAVSGDQQRSVLLNAVFPADQEKALSATFEAVLLGAEWDPKLEIDPFEVLPWTVEAPEGLRFAGNVGTAFAFTDDGELVQKGRPGSPRLTISPSIGVASVEDARGFAEKRVRELPGLDKIEIARSEPFEAGSLRGWEIVGKARDPKLKGDVCTHQILLVGAEEYFLFVGQVRAEDGDQWVPRFRASAKSWQRKPDAR
jgi:hypothetical protein